MARSGRNSGRQAYVARVDTIDEAAWPVRVGAVGRRRSGETPEGWPDTC